MASTAESMVPKAVITTTTALGRRGAGLAQQPDAVEAGHLQVGEDQVGREAPQLPQRLEAVPRGLGLVALLAEDLRERRARVGLVVDDQDSTLGLCHGSAAL
jgi:hypothetical protein